MNIARAESIEGGMNPIELEWLAERASRCQRVAEIGSWQGRSTMALADNCPGEVWAVDHWNGSEEHHPENWTDPDWVAKAFHANLREHIESGKVKPARMASVDFAAQWRALGRPPFDMVFIDASHDYDSVKADILAWKPLTRGLLCGHDHGHPPIERVIKELFGGLPTVPGGSIWYTEI